ncbi:MAG: hypothetical protein DRJ41_05100 [Thermoprotei archaeon]|nr:MAG: hypothetical protein DRJ41_05100 [Thermoprotei archaeon]
MTGLLVSSKVKALSKTFGFSPEVVTKIVDIYGLWRTERILSLLKKPGKRYFLRVNTLKASRDEAKTRLEEEGITAHVFPYLKDTLYISVKGPFEVRVQEKKVVADKAAAESVYMGANLYAPGVITAKRVKAGDRVTVVDPRGFPVAEGIAEIDGDEMENISKGLAVRTIRSVYKVPSIRELKVYREGLIYDQSLPSILAVHILSPKEWWRVVDMCAAPGGKATHAAQLMNDKGEVLAIDRSREKVKKIEENKNRLGIRSIKTFIRDSRYLDLEEEFHNVDAVILDPPCSSLGVRPKLYYERGLEDIKSLSKYQRQFLSVASKIVKKGGFVLYSTCTLTLEENEANMWWAYKFLRLKPIAQGLFLGTRGFSMGSLEGYLFQRFDPHLHDTPGFFISLLVKG